MFNCNYISKSFDNINYFALSQLSFFIMYHSSNYFNVFVKMLCSLLLHEILMLNLQYVDHLNRISYQHFVAQTGWRWLYSEVKGWATTQNWDCNCNV